MKLFRMVSVCMLVCCLMLGCVPLKRGFQDGALVSTGQPPVSITSSLPLRQEGVASPFMNVEMQLLTSNVWVAVYGAQDSSAPMAIASYAVVPAPESALQWDYASISFPDGPVASQVDFGGQTFSGTVRVISAEKDPFAPLVLTPEQAKDFAWLAQRFSVLLNNRKSKIVLEYREPLPAWAEPFASNSMPLLGTPQMREFEQRAQAAFQVAFNYIGNGSITTPRIAGLNQRYLGAFLGSISYVNPPFTESSL